MKRSGTLVLLLLAACAPAADAADVDGQACERVLRDAGLGIEIELPERWCATPADFAGAGAASGWEVLACGAAGPYRLPREPRCALLWLHTEASFRAAEARCREATGEPYSDSCWEGWPFRREDFERERRRFESLGGSGGGGPGAVASEDGLETWRATDGRLWYLAPGVANWLQPIDLATFVGETRVGFALLLVLPEPDALTTPAEVAEARRARWRALAPELAGLAVRRLEAETAR